MRPEEALQDYNARYPANLAFLSAERGGMAVSPSGSFDLSSSQGLLNLLSSLVEAAEPGSMLRINLSKVSYLPSTAIGALSTALVKAKQKNMGFHVCEVPESIDKIIRLLGFREYFNIE